MANVHQTAAPDGAAGSLRGGAGGEGGRAAAPRAEELGDEGVVCPQHGEAAQRVPAKQRNSTATHHRRRSSRALRVRLYIAHARESRRRHGMTASLRARGSALLVKHRRARRDALQHTALKRSFLTGRAGRRGWRGRPPVGSLSPAAPPRPRPPRHFRQRQRPPAPRAPPRRCSWSSAVCMPRARGTGREQGQGPIEYASASRKPFSLIHSHHKYPAPRLLPT